MYYWTIIVVPVFAILLALPGCVRKHFHQHTYVTEVTEVTEHKHPISEKIIIVPAEPKCPCRKPATKPSQPVLWETK